MKLMCDCQGSEAGVWIGLREWVPRLAWDGEV
jgi:hypothetical protein